MSFDFRLPKITAGTDSEKIAQLTRYIYQLTEQLNFSLNTVEAAAGASTGQSVAPAASKGEEEKLGEAYTSIKSMIIKSADFIESLTEKVNVELNGSYLSKSDFGEYLETTKVQIRGESVGFSELYSYTSNLRSDYGEYEVENKSYIKTGLLYQDGTQPVFGVGIGLLHASTDADGKRVIDRGNLATTFTADKISFWGSERELAYITPTQVYFPSGTLTAHEATITGSVTATAGEIGGCEIVDGKLRIPTACISGRLTVGQLPEGVARKDDIPTSVSALTNDSGYLTENGVVSIVDGHVNADYVNALGVSAASLEVEEKFSASRSSNEVRIGGFIVENDCLRSATGKAGKYQGTTTNGNYCGTEGVLYTCLVNGKGIVYRVYADIDAQWLLEEFVSYKETEESSGGGAQV